MPSIVNQAVMGAIGARRHQVVETYSSSSGGNGGLNFTVTGDLRSKNEEFRVRASVIFNKKVTSAFLREVLNRARDIVGDVLSPIRRTGDLEHSFQYKLLTQNRQAIIYSDKKAASAIQQGFHRMGGSAKILKWMDYIPKFSHLEGNERRQVAYLIFKRIESGGMPGPSSTLRQLSPSQDRQYPYMEKIVEQLNKEVGDLLQEVGRAAEIE